MPRMKKRYRRMVDTRRLYKLEQEMYEDDRYLHLTKQRSYKYIIKMARDIWRNERIKTEMPKIRFGNGILHGNNRYSWCDGETIELAVDQQDIITLIHELVHGMGFDDHDAEFVKKEVRLLKKYAKLNKELISEAFETYDYN